MSEKIFTWINGVEIMAFGTSKNRATGKERHWFKALQRDDKSCNLLSIQGEIRDNETAQSQLIGKKYDMLVAVSAFNSRLYFNLVAIKPVDAIDNKLTSMGPPLKRTAGTV